MSRLGPFEENAIVVGDCLDIMAQMPDGCVGLVVTSPPFNLGNRYARESPRGPGGKWSRVIQYGDYQDNLPPDEYIAWQHNALLEMWRLLSADGAIFYNHKPRIQRGTLITRLELMPTQINLRQIIIWARPKGHNFNPGYFVPSYEWIFLLAKPDFKLVDDAPGLGDVWRMNPAPSGIAEATFPEELVRRAIESTEAKIVADFFMGSGTTAVVADRLGRKFFGCDINPDYVEMALERLKKDRAGRQLSLL